ncbi:MAG: hypothetical protein N3E44_05955 [Candidatus Bathyarchaeota archaeon]|nr:hypothetical protein [Candidatus Bathyarchaeota archaeon]
MSMWLSERIVGLAARRLKLDREELILATRVGGCISPKLNHSRLSRKHRI